MKRFQTTVCCGVIILSTTAAVQASTDEQIQSTSIKKSFIQHALTSPRQFIQSENVQILKDIFNKQLSIIDENLTRASRFLFSEYNKGNNISQNECEMYESRISQNYSLHSYRENDGTEKSGVKLCPTSHGNLAVFNGEWIYPSTVKYTYSNQAINNILDVKGAGILSIEYQEYNPYHTQVSRQYIFDSQFKMLEFRESRTENSHRFWTVISAVDAYGNILAKAEKNWSNPGEPYLWKRAITYIPVDGGLSSGMRYYQNDGKGIEVERNSYLMPYNWHWDAYEVSPYTRNSGLYRVNDKITDWPRMQANLAMYKRANVTCEGGYVGFDEHGNFIREFGNQRCAEELDVNTTSN